MYHRCWFDRPHSNKSITHRAHALMRSPLLLLFLLSINLCTVLQRNASYLSSMAMFTLSESYSVRKIYLSFRLCIDIYTSFRGKKNSP